MEKCSKQTSSGSLQIIDRLTKIVCAKHRRFDVDFQEFVSECVAKYYCRWNGSGNRMAYTVYMSFQEARGYNKVYLQPIPQHYSYQDSTDLECLDSLSILDQDESTIVYGKIWLNYTNRELADILDISHTTINTKFVNALSKLRRLYV